MEIRRPEVSEEECAIEIVLWLEFSSGNGFALLAGEAGDFCFAGEVARKSWASRMLVTHFSEALPSPLTFARLTLWKRPCRSTD
jgi:hypothetical protein